METSIEGGDALECYVIYRTLEFTIRFAECHSLLSPTVRVHISQALKRLEHPQ